MGNDGKEKKNYEKSGFTKGMPSKLSPVEKIISERHGKLGLRVYALIDGQRTAAEMMHEAGLSEAGLVEILDFLDEQGIIKLDYPKAPMDKNEKLVAEKFGENGKKAYRGTFYWKNLKGLNNETEIGKKELIRIVNYMVEQGLILTNHKGEFINKSKLLSLDYTAKSLYEKTSGQFDLDAVRLYLLIDEKTPLTGLQKQIPKAKEMIDFFIENKIVVLDPFSRQKIPCFVKKTSSNFPPLIYDQRFKGDLKEIRKYDKGFEKSIKYYELGVFSKAAEELEKSRTKGVVYYVNQGAILLMNNNFKGATGDFTKALDIDPKNFRALYNRALAGGETENSFLDINRAIELKADNPLFYYLRGQCYECSKKFSNATKDYEKALQLKPDFELAKKRLETVKGKIPLEINNSEGLPEMSDSMPKYKLSDVGGMKKLKDEKIATRLLILKHPEKAKEFGIYFGGGMIFYGPSGCGKTYVSEAIAGEMGVTFIKAKIPDILNKWVGNSEKNLHNLFESARRKQPAIIFFDEIDALGGSREEINEHWGRVFINQFLKEMDEVKQNKENILVIGATNAPWHIDAALTRTGRFSDIIFINSPELQERKEIFRIHLREINVPVEIDLDLLAKSTEGFSGSDIAHICEEIRLNAFKEAVGMNRERKINNDDFIQVIEKGKQEGKFNKVREWFEKAKGHGSDYAPGSGSEKKGKEWNMFG